MTATAQMTAQEFLARPLDPFGRRWQLIDGELVLSADVDASDSQGRSSSR